MLDIWTALNHQIQKPLKHHFIVLFDPSKHNVKCAINLPELLRPILFQGFVAGVVKQVNVRHADSVGSASQNVRFGTTDAENKRNLFDGFRRKQSK
jgi:hypothetical protein